MPFAEGLTTIIDLPHTISSAITYRTRIDGFQELPENKQPPRGLWDKPFALKQYMDEIFSDKNTKSGGEYYEYNAEDVE